MNGWFLIRSKWEVLGTPGFYFTGDCNSYKFLFKFILNGKILDGYLGRKKDYWKFCFTNKLKFIMYTGIFPNYINEESVPELSSIYHPSLIYGINCLTHGANDDILKYMKDENIHLIYSRVIL